MKSKTRVALLIFGIAALISLATVDAASLKWVSASDGAVESCACEAQRIAFEINNDAAATQKYALNADFGTATDKFSFFLPPSIEVPAYSRKTVTLIAAPACDAPLEEYSFVLTASGSSGQELSLYGSIRVVECRSIKINAPAQIPTCSGETAAFEVRVVNDGETRANGALVTDLVPGKFAFSDSSFDLAPGTEKTAVLRVTIPALTPPGEIPFKINAVAHGVYAEALSRIVVLDCSGLKIIAPPVIDVEPATSQKKIVRFRNDATGADSFVVSLVNCPNWVVFETKTVSLEAGASSLIELTITPPNEAAGKEVACVLKARSMKRGNEFEATTRIRVVMPSAALVTAPLGGEYCESATPLDFSFTVKNTGVYQGTFEITASGAPGSLDAALASIAPGESKRFVFSLDASRPGDYSLAFSAKTAFATTTKTTSVKIVKCDDFTVALTPNSASVCVNETKNFSLAIRNTGRRADSYSITVQAPGFAASAAQHAVSLSPSENATLAISVMAPSDAAAGNKTVIATVKSNAAQVTKTASASLEVVEAASCASAGTASGATGQFASVYAGAAGFLIALVAGLFVVFILAGRKKIDEEESGEGEEKKAKTKAALRRGKAEKK
ncbi:MAG: hypothetical protein QW343_01210 [Candidatus Norongarragalinales archaeon]